jgi:hypothetical protein
MFLADPLAFPSRWPKEISDGPPAEESIAICAKRYL